MENLETNDNTDEYDVVSIDTIEILSKEEELNMALIEIELSDEDELDSEIQRLTNEIERIKDNKPKKACELRVKLEKCDKIKSLFGEISQNKNTTTISGEQELPKSNIETSKNEKNKLVALEELREDYLSMPTMCPERIVMELIEHVEMQQLFDKDADDQLKESFDFVERLNDLESALMKQDLLKEKMRLTVQDVKVLYRSKAEFSSISKLLKTILLELMPVNFREIQRLLNKSQSAAEQIKDRDIILFVGITGSGKSTTIQFLSGCNMIQKKQEIAPGKFLLHIEPDENTRNLCSENIIASAENTSTTRYIAAQHVPLERIFGPNRNGFITLCDAPGFEDTAGTEVDVANSIGVSKALCGCKSVKIVVLSSYRSLGDNGEGISKLANVLINMIDDVTGRLASINYVFTKFPADYRNVNAMLTNIRDCANQNEMLETNKAFMSILDDMIDKTEQKTLFVDPIGGDRRELINNFLRMRGITSPGSVFQSSLSGNSKAMLRSQAQLDKKNVQTTLKENNMTLVRHYLYNLKCMRELTQQEFIRDIYKEANTYMKDAIDKMYQNALTSMNRVLTGRDGLSAEDIVEYRRNADLFDNIESIFKVHFKPNEILFQSSNTECHCQAS